MWYPDYTPNWVQSIFNGLIWRGPHQTDQLFLTFDDGPKPGSTEPILDALAMYDIKATFFCVGENIEKYPSLFHRLIEEGHQVGGHTYNHLNGWKTSFKSYVSNVEKGQSLVPTKLFRPPYGRLGLFQWHYLKNKEKVVMWDIIPGDFDPKRSVDDCITCIKSRAKAGSIIVLHDNPSYVEKVVELIHQMVQWARDEGFSFDILAD